jgi:hypothetical protein
LMFFHLIRPRSPQYPRSRSFDLRLFKKFRHVIQKVLFNRRLRGRLPTMKSEIWVVLDLPDDSDEKLRINHANYGMSKQFCR